MAATDLRRDDDGCLFAHMFDLDIEMNGRDLRLIAASHNYKLHYRTAPYVGDETFDFHGWDPHPPGPGLVLLGKWGTEDGALAVFGESIDGSVLDGTYFVRGNT